jgi:hypothetical protein
MFSIMAGVGALGVLSFSLLRPVTAEAAEAEAEARRKGDAPVAATFLAQLLEVRAMYVCVCMCVCVVCVACVVCERRHTLSLCMGLCRWRGSYCVPTCCCWRRPLPIQDSHKHSSLARSLCLSMHGAERASVTTQCDWYVWAQPCARVCV